MSWVHTCRDHARARGLPEASWQVLLAFGSGAEADGRERFEGLWEDCVNGRDALATRVMDELTAEVDAEQAAMFARRFAQVLTRLQGLDHDEAQLLAVGLSRRVSEVLDTGATRRSVRVRAAIDFFYSQGAVLEHRLRREQQGVATLSLDELVEGATWAAVAPGITHGTLIGETEHGPQHIHVATVAPGAAELRVVDAYGDGHQDFGALARAHGAAVATSGGYFLYSEADVQPPSRRHDPVGLVLTEGQVLAPAVFRRAAVLQDREGAFALAQMGPEQHQVEVDGAWEPVRGALNASMGQSANGVHVVGAAVVDGAGGAPSLNGLVLPGVQSEGGAVRWAMTDPRWRAGLSGGPFLLRDGVVGYDLAAEEFCGDAPPQTFSGDETGDRNLLPRMGVGSRPDGTLVLAAVDGRNLEQALGLTLTGLGELLLHLGCRDGMNMDGGSSKRMAIAGEVVDMPTTEVVTAGTAGQPVRPVHTALLFVPSGGSSV